MGIKISILARLNLGRRVFLLIARYVIIVILKGAEQKWSEE